MWIVVLLLVLAIFLIVNYLKKLNKDYYILAMCKRIKTVDGSKLEDKVHLIPSKTIFGHNLDFLNANASG